MVQPDLKYTRTHLWCKVEQDVVTLGLTERAVKDLGTIQFVELPDVEDDVLTEVPLIELETETAVVSLHSPVDGVVIEAHDSLEENPGKIEKDPYGAGWLIKVRMQDKAEADALMTAAQYEEFLAGK